MNWEYKTKGSFTGYILTDDDSYVLVGRDEDEYLVWQDNVMRTYKNKQTTNWGVINKQTTNWNYEPSK